MRAQISLEALIGFFIIVSFVVILLDGIIPQIKKHNELIYSLKCTNEVNRELIVIDYLSTQCINCVAGWEFEIKNGDIQCGNTSKKPVENIKKNIFGEIYEK